MNNRPSHIIYLLALAGFCTIASCRVGRNYVRPDLNVPEEYDMPDTVNGKVKDVIEWRKFFHDTVLVNLIDHAITHNFAMRDAMKNIEIAHQYYRQSGAAFLPSFNAGFLEINRQYRSENFYSSPSSGWYERDNKKAPEVMYNYQSQFSHSIGMNWEIDIWGKLQQQKEESQAKYLQTYEAKKTIQTGLIAAIADNYYSLLMLDEQLEVAKRNYDYRNSNLKMVGLQYESGEVTALAVQQTKTQMLDAAALIPRLEEQVAVLENVLMLITGRLPGEITRTANLSDVEIDTEYNVLFDLPLGFVQNRPDVLYAEYRLKAANARVGVAQAYRYPNLSISLNGGLNAMLPQNWFNIPGSLFGGFSGGLTQPLFNRRKLKTDYEVAKLERDKAEIDFQKNVYEAIVETNNALISINKIREQITVMEEQVNIARKAVKNADMLFKAGFATYLEVINAQRQVLDAELRFVTLKANLLTARVQLYRALGGGWK